MGNDHVDSVMGQYAPSNPKRTRPYTGGVKIDFCVRSAYPELMAEDHQIRDVDWWNTARRWRARLVARNLTCRKAFEELLEEAKCQEEDLVVLLMKLESAKDRKGGTNMRPSDLKAFAKNLTQWARRIRTFEGSQFAAVVDQRMTMEYSSPEGKVVEVDWVNLPMRLEHLAAQVRQVSGVAAKHRNLSESLALMRLEDYVRTSSIEAGRGDKPHHKALDDLAEAILGRKVSVRHQAMRYRELFAPSSSTPSKGAPVISDAEAVKPTRPARRTRG